MFRIKAQNDILKKSPHDVDHKGATICELDEVLENMQFSEKVSIIHIFKEDGSNHFVDLTHEDGTYILTYGDGRNEYWAYDGEESSVGREKAITCLRNFALGKDYKEGIDWIFFQEQSSRGCLGVVLSALIVGMVLCQVLAALV